ncbi:hypothetical protein [Liquorilactobacillus sicerae]|nr:hypothetical protein [Liquorilactobacillus sicerae]
MDDKHITSVEAISAIFEQPDMDFTSQLNTFFKGKLKKKVFRSLQT